MNGLMQLKFHEKILKNILNFFFKIIYNISFKSSIDFPFLHPIKSFKKNLPGTKYG